MSRDWDSARTPGLNGIADLARASGVTSRTLRHYDRIGLLRPARTGHNGYRYYGWEESLRLQRILLLRELGLGLEAIGGILDGGRAPLDALRVHRRWLDAERQRLGAMAASVDATMERLARGGTLGTQDMFNGFGKNPYEDEARERWGDAAVDNAHARLDALAPPERSSMMDKAREINRELAACMAAGEPAGGPRAQAAVERHYRWVCLSWTPTATAYEGLGRMYVDDPRFTAFYDAPRDEAARPGLAAYLLEGIEEYAASVLRHPPGDSPGA
jgi:DNA-binding transcriptional MerR regulator